MILQSLCDYYGRMAELGNEAIAPKGWIRRPVDYFIVIAPGGTCISIEDNGWMEDKRRIARKELVPAIGKQALKHTNSGKDPNLLWDNAAFVLGLGNNGALKAACFDIEIDKWFDCFNDLALSDLKIFLRSMRKQGAAKELMERFGLMEVFERRDPILAFRWLPDGPTPIYHRTSIREEYARRCAIESEGPRGNCLVTGATDVPIALNETVIKSVFGAQISGANIVSFNFRSFESYGKREKGGENSPISKQASFAYTTALNQLLSQEKQRLQVGDATTVFWSEKETRLENEFADLLGEPSKNDDDPARHVRTVEAMLNAPHMGIYSEDERDIKFFILGLAAPAKARLSVRFWHVGTVGEMAERIRSHFRDIAIAHAIYEKPHLSLYRLLKSTATQEESKNILPSLVGEFMRAILAGLPYPQTLLYAAIRRNRAERDVKYPRASLIKACLNRQIRYLQSQEKEITVSLDESNTNPGYRIGRLFAALEKVQEEASPNLNATIRDRFYGAASSTPVTVFANLMKLKNHHLAKLEAGRTRYFEKLIGQIMSDIHDFPPHLSLADQGCFAVGYYHQRQAFFTKSESTPSNHKGE